MKWTKAKRLSASQFKRRFGVNRTTFDKMAEIVKEHSKTIVRINNRGRPKAIGGRR